MIVKYFLPIGIMFFITLHIYKDKQYFTIMLLVLNKLDFSTNKHSDCGIGWFTLSYLLISQTELIKSNNINITY